MDGIRVASGNLFLFFAYDIGFEIPIAEAARLCSGIETPGLGTSRPAPPHLQHRPKPLTVPCGEVVLDGPTGMRRLSATARLFDFGVLSVTLSLPVADLPWEDYVSAALKLASDPVPGAEAAAIARRIFESVKPVISRPSFAELVEEYAVWHVAAFTPEMDGEALRERMGADIARLLMLEPGIFAPQALPELLASPVRYYVNDLFLAEWDAAFVYDPKSGETLEVLEFLNVQLLELRFFDRILHKAIDEMGEEIRKKRNWFSLLHDPYERPLRRLSELKLDVTLLLERTANTLKMTGSAYLARVYEAARRKSGAEQWESTIREQLRTLEDIYTVLNNRAAASRAETLETVIIALILIEIVMGLFRP